jgi:pimeloyl-ACP methyl ester carboxylesterase
VIAVLDALKLEKPVLVGHSIAGAELSAVANSHADRVAGLIYLEAGYPYAFDNGKGAKMQEFQKASPRSPKPGASDLASFSALQKWDADSSGRPLKMRDSLGAQAFAAILASDKPYTRIPVPALVIFAHPHVPERWIEKSPDPATREAARLYYAPGLTPPPHDRRRHSKRPCPPRVWSGCEVPTTSFSRTSRRPCYTGMISRCRCVTPSTAARGIERSNDANLPRRWYASASR